MLCNAEEESSTLNDFKNDIKKKNKKKNKKKIKNERINKNNQTFHFHTSRFQFILLAI